MTAQDEAVDFTVKPSGYLQNVHYIKTQNLRYETCLIENLGTSPPALVCQSSLQIWASPCRAGGEDQREPLTLPESNPALDEPSSKQPPARRAHTHSKSLGELRKGMRRYITLGRSPLLNSSLPKILGT